MTPEIEHALKPSGHRLIYQVAMSPFEAVHAVRLLGVSHVVPIHHGTFPLLTGTPEEFQRHVGEIAPDVTVHVMRPGDDLAPRRLVFLKGGRGAIRRGKCS